MELKLRLPIAYKVEDGWLWYLSGAKPKWKRGYYLYSSEVGSIINQPFAANAVSFYKDLGMKGHNGTDWWCPVGTTLFAVQDGTIGYINNPKTVDYNDGYGGFVELLFTVGVKKYRYIYGHLETTRVKRGQRIYAGQVIGTGDNTGKYTTGSHLHSGLMELDGNGARLNTGNGYLGYVDDAPYYISELAAKPLEPLEALYWQERITGHGYYGPLGSMNWSLARSTLGIKELPISRGDYYDYSRKHKWEAK